jgi:large subunit ribosomal protein L31
MAKKNLHPEWYNTKVYCDGKLVLEVGTTKKELFVDIWSGNHPFYTGSQKIIDTEGRVEKFQKRYNFFENSKEKDNNN